MNILIVCHDHTMYGASLSLLDLLKNNKQSNLSITVLVPKKDTLFEQKLLELGVKTVVFEYKYHVKRLKKGIVTRVKNIIKYFIFKTTIKQKIKKAVKLLSVEKFDYVISNSFATMFGFYIAQELKVPHTFYVREFIDVPLGIQHFVNVDYACKCSKAIYISKSIENYYSKKYNFIDSIQVYDNIDLQFGISNINTLNKNNIKICMIGSLQDIKGQEDIIRATAILENQGYNIELNIAGIGPDEVKLKKLTEKLNLKNCNFLGQVGDIFYIYKISHISTICSKKEALGRVTVESLAAGLYVVGTTTGETGYLLSENRGLTYQSGNYNDLSQKIKLIIDGESFIDVKKNQEFTRDNFIEPILPKIIEFLKK